MALWIDESVLQRPPSEDSGCHRAGHAQGPGGPYLWGRDLHRQALRHQGPKGESLEPAKAPGKPPKMDERVRKLLEVDLKERLFVTSGALRLRGGHKRVSVSRSTMCRAIARIGSTRAKGGRSATERDEFLRAAWWVMVAAEVDPKRLVFVDDGSAHSPCASVRLLC